MCNIWTNEHVFIWTGSATSDARLPAGLICRCGAFRYDGKPANITYSSTKNYDMHKELKLKTKYYETDWR